MGYEEPTISLITVKEEDVIKIPNNDYENYPWDIYVARHGEIVVIATAYSNRKIHVQLT